MLREDVIEQRDFTTPEGFKVVVQQIYDHDGREKFEEDFGTFYENDPNSPDAIELDKVLKRRVYGGQGRYRYDYFVPGNYFPSEIKDNFKHYVEVDGMKPREAIAKARENYREFLELAAGWVRDEWEYVGVVATVFFDGEELAESSVWGVDTADDDYVKDTEEQEITSALHKARENGVSAIDLAITTLQKRRELLVAALEKGAGVEDAH